MLEESCHDDPENCKWSASDTTYKFVNHFSVAEINQSDLEGVVCFKGKKIHCILGHLVNSWLALSVKDLASASIGFLETCSITLQGAAPKKKKGV